MQTKNLIMKKINLLIVSIALILSACTNKNTYKTPETEMEKVSYSLGVNMASSVKSQGLDSIDANAVAKAFDDVFKENDLDISEEESMKILQEFFGKLQAEKSAQANEAILVQAREEAQTIISQAKEVGDKLKIKLENDGQAKYDSLLNNAKEQINIEKQKALSDIKSMVVDIAINASEKVIKRNLNDDDNKKMIEETVDQLQQKN